jgi:hypothetical protein
VSGVNPQAAGASSGETRIMQSLHHLKFAEFPRSHGPALATGVPSTMNADASTPANVGAIIDFLILFLLFYSVVDY